MGIYKFEIKEFILNLLALRTSYNHPAWFLRLYVILILIYPMLIKIVDRYNKYVWTVYYLAGVVASIMNKAKQVDYFLKNMEYNYYHVRI